MEMSENMVNKGQSKRCVSDRRRERLEEREEGIRGREKSCRLTENRCRKLNITRLKCSDSPLCFLFADWFYHNLMIQRNRATQKKNEVNKDEKSFR